MSTATNKTRGPYARTTQRRQAVARAVLDLVLEKGHGNVTTAEVARRAGSSEAAVLYHFPSKDHLLVAGLQCSDDEEEARQAGREGEDGRETQGSLDVEEELKEFARGTERRENVLRLYTALSGHASTPGHPAQEYFAGHYRAAVARFAKMVEQRQAAGVAHPGLDPVEVARQFIAVWDGLQAQWLVNPDFELGEVLVRAFRRLTAQNWMEARALLMSPEAGL